MIFYATKYGSSKKAALLLANCLSCQALPLKQMDPAVFKDPGESLILVMPLYAGSLYQSRSAVKILKKAGISKFILVTVGLADPKDGLNAQSIAKAAHSCFKDFDFDLFSVRGQIDYSLLNPKDRLMMAALKKMIEKKPDERENQQLLETYGKRADLLDAAEIEQEARRIQASRFFRQSNRA